MFFHFDGAEKQIRLDKSNAEFVDVYHSDHRPRHYVDYYGYPDSIGKKSLSYGKLVLLLLKNISKYSRISGHVDFYWEPDNTDEYDVYCPRDGRLYNDTVSTKSNLSC